VQEISVPRLIPPSREGNLSDLPHDWASRDPGRELLARRQGDAWRGVSAAEFCQQVRALAKGFIAAGIGVGDRVAIMSRTRYEWTLADFALWTAGAVPVPVYETSSHEQLSWILQDSGAVAIILEDAGHLAVLSRCRDEVPHLRDVWQIETGALDELVTAGAEVPDEEVDARRAQLDRSSPATIIYTSGTTGRPKGCVLTHDNFMALSENAVERLAEVVAPPGARTLLFLPLAHVFARFIQVVVMQAGATLGHSPNVKTLLKDLASFQPTFVLAVPRVFEKIYNSAEQKAVAGGRGRIFHRAVNTAIRYSRAQDTGGPGLGLRLQHALFSRLVYGKLLDAMGGKVEYAISGGAALGERLGHFFRGIGLVVLEGYGLTETTAPATVNTPELIKIGTVGRPLPGVTVRIAGDGEVLVKGINVLSHYHANDEATSQTIRDGWFHTGDIGELDPDGFLRITGRKKEIIVTAGGKNVAPAVLEDRVRAHPLVSQCVVVGDARPFIGALITLDAEMLPGWAANHGIEGISLDDAVDHPVVQEALQQAIDRANEAVSRAESIRRFTVLRQDLTVENGYLTPSLKVKRDQVLADFAAEIEALYAAAPPQAAPA
jgi:long-chain acyl-CoA synthetase